jgi:hypothetical protein
LGFPQNVLLEEAQIWKTLQRKSWLQNLIDENAVSFFLPLLLLFSFVT